MKLTVKEVADQIEELCINNDIQLIAAIRKGQQQYNLITGVGAKGVFNMTYDFSFSIPVKIFLPFSNGVAYRLKDLGFAKKVKQETFLAVPSSDQDN